MKVGKRRTCFRSDGDEEPDWPRPVVTDDILLKLYKRLRLKLLPLLLLQWRSMVSFPLIIFHFSYYFICIMICYAVPGHPELDPVIYAVNSGNLVPIMSIIIIIISLCKLYITFHVSFLSILTLNTLITSFLLSNNLCVAFQASFLKDLLFYSSNNDLVLCSCNLASFPWHVLAGLDKGLLKMAACIQDSEISIMQLLQERPMCPSIIWSKWKSMMSIWKMGRVLSLPLFCKFIWMQYKQRDHWSLGQCTCYRCIICTMWYLLPHLVAECIIWCMVSYIQEIVGICLNVVYSFWSFINFNLRT